MAQLESDQTQQACDAAAPAKKFWRDYAPTADEAKQLGDFEAALSDEQHTAADAYLKSIAGEEAYAFADLMAALKLKFPALPGAASPSSTPPATSNPTPPPADAPESPAAVGAAAEASAPSSSPAPDAAPAAQ